MRSGYLLIESRGDPPGEVRLEVARLPPPQPAPLCPPDGSPRLHYMARFDDIEAARMHAHHALRHRLVDVDAHLYRTDALTAVAAVETIALARSRLYLDPFLASHPHLGTQIARRRAALRRRERIWQGIGGVAVVLLLALVLLGL